MRLTASIKTKGLILILLVFLAGGCASGNQVQAPLAASTPTLTSTPSMAAGFGVVGDSTSDEYRADDGRGGSHGETTLNWVEQLVKSRGLNFGVWGTREEPRRTGYEYNWARTGATANTLLTSGQADGLAGQVAEGKVSYAVIWIGNNDFHLKNGPYEEIYNRTLSDADLQSKLDGIVRDITAAMDIILKAGDVKLAVVTIADQGIAPQARILFPNAEKRQRVTNAVNQVNDRIKEWADAHGVLVVDSNAIGNVLLSRVDWKGEISVSDEKVTVLTKGDDPHHLQLDDNIGHAGTVLSGIIANKLFIEPFDDAFGLDIQPLTDDEILQNAGLR